MASTHHFPGREPEPAVPSSVSGEGSTAGLASRDRLLIRACLFAVVALVWGYLFYLDRQMASAMVSDTTMAGMDMPIQRPWAATDFLFTFAMWIVMMVGMMAGPVAPVLLLFAAAHARRGSRRVPLVVLAFGLGYVVVWIGFSACAALAQWALHDATLLSPALALSSSSASAAVLVAVGMYQVTPLKSACLRHCQSPLGFLMSHWRDGMAGAFQMGMRHGIYCLGCCWALMAVLFVVGVMNLAWVALLTLFILLEKIGPAGVLVSRAAGAVMLVAGIVLMTGML